MTTVFITPPSATLLESCPQFESLNKKLTLSLLDQDAAVRVECQSYHAIEVGRATLIVINIAYSPASLTYVASSSPL